MQKPRQNPSKSRKRTLSNRRIAARLGVSHTLINNLVRARGRKFRSVVEAEVAVAEQFENTFAETGRLHETGDTAARRRSDYHWAALRRLAWE